MSKLKIGLFESYSRGDEDAIVPFKFITNATNEAFRNHARDTISIIKSKNPNCEIHLLPFNNRWARKYVIDNDIRIVNISLATNEVYEFMEEMAQNTFIVQAVGNYGDKGEVVGAVWEKCCAVGSVDSNLIPRVNSGWGKNAVDTVAIDGLNYGNGNLHGTSFSAPVVTGGVSLFIEWYYKKFNDYPTPKECFNYVKENSYDIWETGKDNRTGYGLFKAVPILNSLLIDIRNGAIKMNPLKNMYVTSPYGERIHPITGETDFHNGIDLRANFTEAYAVDDGKIAKVGDSKGLGKYLIIEHEKILTIYGHLNEIKYKENDSVKEGDIVAITGSTGSSTAPHLHFEVRKKPISSYWGSDTKGKYINSVDPQTYNFIHWAQIHFDSLNAKGYTIHEKRFDETITRGELFAMLDRITT